METLEQCLTAMTTWTSVEEELPPEKITILFWIEKNDDHPHGCYVGWFSHKRYDGKLGRWFDMFGNAIYQGVTHWCPFPKGPDCTLSVGLKIPNE